MASTTQTIRKWWWILKGVSGAHRRGDDGAGLLKVPPHLLQRAGLHLGHAAGQRQLDQTAHPPAAGESGRQANAHRLFTPRETEPSPAAGQVLLRLLPVQGQRHLQGSLGHLREVSRRLHSQGCGRERETASDIRSWTQSTCQNRPSLM